MDPRYPIGKMEMPKEITAAKRQQAIESLAGTPKKLREAARGLNESQLDTPYREGGWTVRQVLHHVPDSHMNAYIRLKLALTEDSPTIKPYDEVEAGRVILQQIDPAEMSPGEFAHRIRAAAERRTRYRCSSSTASTGT